jgi:hypothetical protein
VGDTNSNLRKVSLTVRTQAPSTLDAAVALNEQGLAVLPCHPATKRPLIRGGVHAASSDPAVTEQRFRAYPTAAIGLATGGGQVVVDIDPKHGGTVSPDWPDTLTTETPSGGRHLYYRAEVAVPCSVGKVAQGVDIRGEAGYVLVPPSPGYRWLNALPVADLPESILRATRGSVSRCHGAGRALPVGWKPFEMRSQVGAGERNAYLASFAGFALRAGIPATELETELVIENRRVCVPPLDSREVARIAASIARYDARDAQPEPASAPLQLEAVR